MVSMGWFPLKEAATSGLQVNSLSDVSKSKVAISILPLKGSPLSQVPGRELAWKPSFIPTSTKKATHSWGIGQTIAHQGPFSKSTRSDPLGPPFFLPIMFSHGPKRSTVYLWVLWAAERKFNFQQKKTTNHYSWANVDGAIPCWFTLPPLLTLPQGNCAIDFP